MNKIIINEDVYDKVMHWVNKTKFEVSGFGKVVRNAEGDFVITEAFLLKQEGGAAHTDISDVSLGKLMYTSKDTPGDLRWWWHSHVMMPVFWSGQDTTTIKELGNNGWIVATVFNQKSEYRSAVCYKAEVDTPWGVMKESRLIDNLDLEVIYPVDEEEQARIAAWDKEFTDNVTEKKWEPAVTRTPHGSQAYIDRGGRQTLIPYPYADPYNDTDNLLTGDPAWDKYVQEEMELAARFNQVASEDDPDYEKDPGMLGYGLVVEAKALGMTPEAYLKKLNSKNQRVINKLEDKLVYLEEKGTLK